MPGICLLLSWVHPTSVHSLPAENQDWLDHRMMSPVGKHPASLTVRPCHTYSYQRFCTPYSNNDPAHYRLRSATGTNYSVPRRRTKFGNGSFSVARPVVWNSLPVAVRHADSLHSFKCKSQITLFSLCFNDWQCNALQVRFRTWKALNSLLLTYLLTSSCYGCHITSVAI